MAPKKKLPAWIRHPRFRWLAVTVVWAILLVTVALPSWRGVIVKNRSIAAMEEQLATLDQWTVAGLWLAPAVAERSLPVNAAFSRLYPDARRREELFLDLARVADESGVEEFGLSESGADGFDANDVWSLPLETTGGTAGDDGPPDDGPPTDDQIAAAMTLDVPNVELDTYRIKARFQGDYGRTARFLSGLEQIERALKVHSLVVRPDREGIQVEMELDVYVDRTHQS